MPDAIVTSFDSPIEATSEESFIFFQIRKHMSKCPTVDSTFFNGMPKTLATGQRNFPQRESNFASNSFCSKVESDRKSKNLTPQFRCLRCNKQGHTKKYCRTRHCGMCKNPSNNWWLCPLLIRGNDRPVSQNFGSSYKKAPQEGYPKKPQNRQNFWKGQNAHVI